MTARFEYTTRVAAPTERVFDLALSIDAHMGSMAEFNEQAVGGVTSGQIALGEEVTWRARHFGLNWTMTNRIVELERPLFFADEQVRGPFKRFRHEHTFKAMDDCTEVVDRVRFEAPLPLAGALVERALRGYLRRLIEKRNSSLKGLAERKPEDQN